MSKPKLPQPKHIPQRTCVVCRATSAKRSLTRIVRTPDAGVHIDPTGKRNGRGAYVCDSLACWKRVLETDVIEKALKTTLTDEDRQRLQKVMTMLPDKPVTSARPRPQSSS